MTVNASRLNQQSSQMQSVKWTLLLPESNFDKSYFRTLGQLHLGEEKNTINRGHSILYATPKGRARTDQIHNFPIILIEKCNQQFSLIVLKKKKNPEKLRKPHVSTTLSKVLRFLVERFPYLIPSFCYFNFEAFSRREEKSLNPTKRPSPRQLNYSL